MNEKVEEVARALSLGMYGEPNYDLLHDDSKEELRISARAVIAAMRQPTVEMIKAANSCVAEIVWKDMIDEVLK